MRNTPKKERKPLIWAVTRKAKHATLHVNSNTQIYTHDTGTMMIAENSCICSYCHRKILRGEPAARETGYNVLYCSDCILVVGESFRKAFDLSSLHRELTEEDLKEDTQ